MTEQNQKTQVKQKTENKAEATANGKDLRISTKYAVAICNMIRNKSSEKALEMLNQVINQKTAVKMNNREVGHRKGKGVMAGRYPKKAAKEFIRLIKQLEANALVREIPLEEYIIECKADVASRPYRREGMRFKRTHILLKLKPKKINKK